MRGVTATLEAAGGTFDLVAPGAIEVTVTVPEGAVESDQAIVIAPESPASGSLLNLTFEPEGLVLMKPATIEVSVPAGIALDGWILHWADPGDPLFMPTTVDEGARTLTIRTRFFGLPGEHLTMPGPAVAPGAYPGLGVQATSHGPGRNNQLGAIQASCAVLVAEARARFDAFVATGDFEDAVKAVLTAAGALVLRGCETEAVDIVDGITETACLEAAARIQDALSKPTLAFGDFDSQVRPVLHWYGALDLLGAVGSCDPPIDLPSFLDSEVVDFVNFVDGEASAMAPYSWDAFQDIRLELSHAWHVWVEAVSLGVSVADRVRTNAVFPLFDQLRDVSYGLAETDGWHYPLSRLTSRGMLAGRDIIGVTPPRPCDDYFTPPRCPSVRQVARFNDTDVFRDLQYAGTDFSIEGITPLDSLVGEGDVVGLSPGAWEDSPSVAVWTRGAVRLSGELLAFTCWNDVEADSDVTLTLDGVNVLGLLRPMVGSNYLSDPAVIDIGAIAESLPSPPSEGNIGKLVGTRTRTACDEGLWGPASYQLFEADLVWVNPTLKVDVQLPGQVAPGASVPVDVRVTVVDPFGEEAFFEGLDVTVGASAGLLGTLAGVTDATGMFQTTLTAPAAAATASGFDGATSSHNPSITVMATAESYEGVAATGQATTTVGSGGPAGGRLEVLSRRTQLTLRATAGSGPDFVQDTDGETLDGPYPFSDYSNSLSVMASATVDGEVNTATASASLDVTYEYSTAPTLSGFTGSATSANDVMGADADAFSIIQTHLIIEVLDDAVNFQYSGTLQGIPGRPAYTIIDRGIPGGGWETPALFEIENSSFNETGALEPGVYRIRIVVSTNSADSSTGSFDFSFQVVTPAPS